MNLDAYMRNLETMALRALLFEFAVTVIVIIVMFWLTYLCIRNGVRDGILLANPRQRAPERPSTPPGFTWKLVKDEAPHEDIRAER